MALGFPYDEQAMTFSTRIFSSLAALVLLSLVPTTAFAQWGFDGVEAPTQPATTELQLLSGAYGRPWKGSENAPVTIVEFSDFECPFCAKVGPTLQALLDQYPGQLQIVFRNNPLEFHSHARGAAEAALAAHYQGRFWEFHDLLFANNKALTDDDLRTYAQTARLDAPSFEVDRKASETADRIDEDIRWAQQLGANGTPTFFVNGKLLVGAQPISAFSALIDEELARAQVLSKLPALKTSVSEALTALNLEEGAFLGDYKEAVERVQHPVAIRSAAFTEGSSDALLTLVRYFHYTDPEFTAMGAQVEQLRALYGAQVRVVYEPLPRTLSPIDSWLGAVLFEAGDEAAAVHQCFLTARLSGTLACAPGVQTCPFEEPELRAELRRLLQSCALGTAIVDRIDADALATMDAQREKGRNYGAAGNALFVNGRRFDGVAAESELFPVTQDQYDLAAKLAAAVPAELVYEVAVNTTERAYVDLKGRTVRGAKSAPVTVVEFSDFECPFCARALPSLKSLREKYPDQIRFYAVNLPLSFHPEARPAALAAWAAGEQGKFWEYHDALFESAPLTSSTYETLAEQLGLDLKRWNKDRASTAAENAIVADEKLARELGISGTPNFLVNGRLLSGAQPLESFVALVDEELNAAQLLAGKLEGDYYEALTKLSPKPAKTAAAVDGERVFVPLGAFPSKGGSNAAVTIIEFSDFQCPYCSKVQAALGQLMTDYGDKVRIVFVDMPLSFHAQAEPAARAAWAAGQQGKYWEFHEALFSQQLALGDDLFVRVAEELQLDIQRFEQDRSGEASAAAVQAGIAEAQKAGLSGTPSFLINGRKFVGAQPYEAFAALVDEELETVKTMTKEKKLKKKDVLYEVLTGGTRPTVRFDKLKLAGMPTKGSKKAVHQVVLFADVSNPFAQDAIRVFQSVVESDLDAQFVFVPTGPTGSSEGSLATRALLVTDDLEQSLALALSFTSSEDLGEDEVAAAIATAGLDDKLLADAQKKGSEKTLKSAMKLAEKNGVLGTPTFIVDGKISRGPLGAGEVLSRMQ